MTDYKHRGRRWTPWRWLLRALDARTKRHALRPLPLITSSAAVRALARTL